ncbi:MAG TPA: protein-disulfide reductase DsbD domain-containing protein [Azospirillum sp.]|nr:protein-disulfide reductase DsbD domain-containing protein [Azospirillum sp.]
MLTGLLAWVSVLVSGAALAASGPVVRGGPVEARLMSAVEGVGDLAGVPLALEVRLDKGWKTYWRSPGDAGLPPRVEWTGSTNLKDAELSYPAPHRMTLLGIETIGYDGAVTFPVNAVPAEPGKPMELKAGLDLLVCSEICVPQRVDVALSLPAGPAAPGPEANAVSRARNTVPDDGRAAGLEIRAVRTQGVVLEVEAAAREPFANPDLFVETDPPVIFKAPTVRLTDGGRTAVLRLEAAEAAIDPPLTGRAATLTLVDGARAMEAQRPMEAGAVRPAGGSALAPVATLPATLPAMLAVALLGGLILNLMPCVLPVLSLKMLSVVAHSDSPRHRVRAGFLASAAGILASFLVLAGAMVGLKAAGAAVGWGIQFQQPLFLVFMVVLVTLFAANLWGLFEIPLPRFLADTAGGTEGHGYGGQFATGAFATLLATPCSAPFLGTAVGFALANGPLEVFAIFTALGVGLALPYLLVAAFPSVARHLPRPGRWMVALRRVLGAALALTGVWLLSVMAVQAGEAVAGLVAALMAALVLALWLGRRLAAGMRWAGPAFAGLLALAAFIVPVQFGGGADAAPVVATSWKPFDEAAIGTLVADGRTVFVDVTADWCITCQANKKLVMNRGEVAKRLDGDVVAMRADWTRPDERIAAYLAAHGRYGIPFNIVYGPGAPDGIALPELLTSGAVLDALDKAGKRP